jgi:hypothetical protein
MMHCYSVSVRFPSKKNPEFYEFYADDNPESYLGEELKTYFKSKHITEEFNFTIYNQTHVSFLLQRKDGQ